MNTIKITKNINPCGKVYPEKLIEHNHKVQRDGSFYVPTRFVRQKYVEVNGKEVKAEWGLYTHFGDNLIRLGKPPYWGNSTSVKIKLLKDGRIRVPKRYMEGIGTNIYEDSFSVVRESRWIEITLYQK